MNGHPPQQHQPFITPSKQAWTHGTLAWPPDATNSQTNTVHLLSAVTIPSSSPSHYDSCACNKSHRLPFGKSSISSSQPLKVLYSDVWGTTPFVSFYHYKYFVIFMDYYSKYTWFFPIHRKSDVTPIFQKFKATVEKYFSIEIKTVYSDGGGEYQGLTPFLLQRGIQHLKSPPHTPQHVGIAERKHSHIG